MAIPPSPNLALPDGRRLAYREFGPTSGRPLLYFHGTPASKHNWYLGHDPEVARAFLAMLAESFAHGPAGAQVDSALVASAWGFDPADVRVPVRMWHGDADENVPIEMARHLAKRVPGAELTVVAGEGHLSLVHRRFGTVLGEH